MSSEKALHLIGGRHLPSESGLFLTTADPASGESIGEMARGGPAEAVSAVREAKARFEMWRSTPGHERATILRSISERLGRDREQMARLISREVGKPLRESRYEVERATRVFAMASDAVRQLKGESFPADAYDLPPGNESRLIFTIREPLGVVVAISPFNFPLNLLSHKIAPALACGNTVVAKPSSAAPFTALRLAEMAVESGLPSGVLNVVLGSGSEVGLALVMHPSVRLITFTGSTEVGRRIAEKAGLGSKRTILEMGGMDALIVFSDADLESAVDSAVRSCFGYSGQVCTATKRILVENGTLKEFSMRLTERTKNLKVGPPLEEATDVGPLINREALERVEAMVRDATDRGATLLTGGRRVEVSSGGNYYEPTILCGVPLDSRIVQEEPFGPIAPIQGFSSEEEAIEMANATRYGLQASVYTRDVARAFRVARRLSVGGVHVNDPTSLRWDALPFGGVKASGLGREGIDEAMREMTETKLITVNLK